ncbi:hypothetical protein EDB89DRAFT_227304 [Lactarius sanguifluus]|nr:hypothetical protein EDB89DRAFT_227304 [Lactarius sanguifluus]
MYVHALEDFNISQLLPRDASSREALRPKTLLAQTPDLPTFQHLAPSLLFTSGLLTTEDAETSVTAAAVDPLLGSADESDAFLPPDRTRSTTSAQHGGRRGICIYVAAEQHGAQLAQMAGQLRRNAEYFSGALAADYGVLRVAEEWGENT